MEATMPAGRPTKYDPAHCEVAEATLAEGFSEAVVAGRLGVCLSTVQNWTNEHPEFLGAVKRGKALGAEVWEQRLHTLAASGEGNATALPKRPFEFGDSLFFSSLHCARSATMCFCPPGWVGPRCEARALGDCSPSSHLRTAEALILSSVARTVWLTFSFDRKALTAAGP
jgi:hypothetical protein